MDSENYHIVQTPGFFKAKARLSAEFSDFRMIDKDGAGHGYNQAVVTDRTGRSLEILSYGP